MSTFGVVNWAVLILYFAAMMYLGSKMGKTNKTTRDYFLGGRRIPWWAIGLSVLATQCSAASFIGMPGWGYTSGLHRVTFMFQFPVVMAILMTTFVPFFYNTKVVSVYEYLEKRFGSKSRTLLAVIFLLSRGLQTAVVLFAPALALSTITGLSTKTAVLLMGVIAIIYTVTGGISAVIWTDVVQMFIIYFGIVLAIVIPIFTVDGGLGTILSNASGAGLLTGLDYSFNMKDSYTFWGGLFGSGFLYLAYLGTDQSQIQRVLTARNIRESKLSLAFSGFIAPLQTLLFLFSGICLYSAYNGQQFENSDMVMLSFVSKYLPVGIAGLVTAGVFAAGMSSLDSALNSLATVSVNDIYKKINPKADDAKCLKVSRLMTLVWGVFATVVALFLGGVLDIINTIGPLFYPCLLSAFVLAVFCKKANQKGCIAAVIAGLAIDLYMFKFTSIGSLWWNFLGFLFAVVVGYIVSRITDEKKQVREALDQNFQFDTAVGSELTIGYVTKLAAAGKIAEKDEDGYYVIPGKVDKISYALIAYFIVLVIVLSLI